MRTDTELQRGVMEALAWEPSIDAAGIGVSVESGIVMLNGTVKSLPQKWTAVRVAQHVSGVKAVTDELLVKLPGDSERSDADIARAAVNALDWNASVPSGQRQGNPSGHGALLDRARRSRVGGAGRFRRGELHPHHPLGRAADASVENLDRSGERSVAMEVLQITFRNMTSSPKVEEWVREAAGKLETFYGQITGCHVAVEVPHRHHVRGTLYHVRIDITLPGGELVIKREASLARSARSRGQLGSSKQSEIDAPHKNLRTAINDAFKAAARRIQDYGRRQRGDVKTHRLTRARIGRTASA